MKPLAILILCCVSTFATDANDAQVITTATSNVASSTVTTVDVFTRSGRTNLVRQTEVADGGVHIRLQRFYHDGSLVCEFGAVTNNRAFATAPGSSYRLSFGFSPSGEILSAVIATKDGACVDAFVCTNGVFYPEDASGIRRAGAYWDAFKEAVVVNFPEKSKAGERR